MFTSKKKAKFGCFVKKEKYGNKKCSYKGIEFDSIKEMERYIYLESLQVNGELSCLEVHKEIEIVPRITGLKEVQLKTKVKQQEYVVQKAINYIADFVFVDKNGTTHYEDVKGSPKTLTKVYQLKKKILFALKGIYVEEIYSPTSDIYANIYNLPKL